MAGILPPGLFISTNTTPLAKPPTILAPLSIHTSIPGQQLDSATSLYNLRARYYDSSVGRFISQDTYPINFNNPIELNRYLYTANNPINMVDPSGLFAAVSTAVLNMQTAKRTPIFAVVGWATFYALIAVVLLFPTVVTWPREIPGFGYPDIDIPWRQRPWPIPGFPNPDDDYAPVPPETTAVKELVDALLKAAEEAARRPPPLPEPEPTTQPQPTTAAPTAFPTPPIILPTATLEPEKPIVLDLGPGWNANNSMVPLIRHYSPVIKVVGIDGINASALELVLQSMFSSGFYKVIGGDYSDSDILTRNGESNCAVGAYGLWPDDLGENALPIAARNLLCSGSTIYIVSEIPSRIDTIKIKLESFMNVHLDNNGYSASCLSNPECSPLGIGVASDFSDITNNYVLTATKR